jgi:tetratricopeptide (TPR) repeat protein
LLTRAIAQTTTADMKGFQALCRLPLGQAHLIAGRLHQARAEAEQALALAREHGERGNEAYALRLRGDIATQGDTAEAERNYREAITLATELGMRPLLAHVHRGLGTLYQGAGKPAQAREHLEAAKAIARDLGLTDQAGGDRTTV